MGDDFAMGPCRNDVDSGQILQYANSVFFHNSLVTPFQDLWKKVTEKVLSVLSH